MGGCDWRANVELGCLRDNASNDGAVYAYADVVGKAAGNIYRLREIVCHTPLAIDEEADMVGAREEGNSESKHRRLGQTRGLVSIKTQ